MDPENYKSLAAAAILQYASEVKEFSSTTHEPIKALYPTIFEDSDIVVTNKEASAIYWLARTNLEKDYSVDIFIQTLNYFYNLREK